jgi:hypothetical protein
MVQTNAQIRKIILELLDEDPDLELIKSSNAKMYVWQTRRGVVFGCEHPHSHLWMPDRDELHELAMEIRSTPYPSSAVGVKRNTDGKPLDGRHSGLRSVPALRDADLIRFEPESPAETVRILARLKALS